MISIYSQSIAFVHPAESVPTYMVAGGAVDLQDLMHISPWIKCRSQPLLPENGIFIHVHIT